MPGMRQGLHELQEELRSLERRARTKQVASGRSASRRAAAEQANHHYHADLDARRISDWLKRGQGARAPRSPDQVWALVQVWASWAGERERHQQIYWNRLVEFAQPSWVPDWSREARTGDDPGYRGDSTQATLALRTLPRDSPVFTGRERQLRHLLDSVTKPGEPGRVVAIHAIDGMAGVGKTAFAVRAGHLLADQYPDGQIFLCLHAHTAGRDRVAPSDALAFLLEAIGVTPPLPLDVDARAALWRHRMNGKRILLILDDVASHLQVSPLLPSSKDCLVLITSRRRLEALDGVLPLELDTMPPNEAQMLYIRLANRDAREAESEAVAELCRLCGHLPLAISLVAGRLRHRPAWSLADLTTALADAQDRLAEIHAEDVAVASAFELSYQDLSRETRRFFRRIGLHPGTDVDADAAAAVAGVPLPTAHRSIEDLYVNHLLNESVKGRYRMHDLVRQYARSLAARDSAIEQNDALERLFDFYQRSADAANWVIVSRGAENGSQTIARDGRFSGKRAEALAWMETERANLLALADYAIKQDQDRRVIDLAAAIARFLRIAGPWDQAMALHSAAVASAARAHDRDAQTNALFELGHVGRLLGIYPQAIEALQEALQVRGDDLDSVERANVLNELGVVWYLSSDYQQAITVLERARRLCQETGYQHGLAHAINNLGSVWSYTGEHAKAIEAHTEALEIFRQMDDTHGQAHALNELATVRRSPSVKIG